MQAAPENAPEKADVDEVGAKKPYHPPRLQAASDFRKLTLQIIGSGGSLTPWFGSEL